MLRQAAQYKDQLSDIWRQAVSDSRFFFWDEEDYYVPDDGQDPDWKWDEWVSVSENGEILGYFAAKINRHTSSVEDFSIATFEKNMTSSYDLVRFIRNLRRRYRAMRWACIKGSPFEERYDKEAYMYGGRIVGVFTEKVRLTDGKLYDEKWYEIMRGSKMRPPPTKEQLRAFQNQCKL